MSEVNVSTAGSEHNLVEVSSRKSSFKKRTQLECILLVVVLILAILLIIFFLLTVILACMNNKAEKITHKATCGTEECIASAYSLLESMDQNVDPCEDFYKFACGNWAKNHPVKETELSNTWFAERSQALIRELKDLLKESNENSSDPNAVLQIKSLYQACTDIEQLESLGLEPIMQVLQNVSLPTEIPNNETATDWDIATTLALVQKTLSLDSLVQLGPDIDSSNNGKLLLNFAPPSEVPQLIRSLVSDPDVMPKAAHLSKPEALKARLTYMVKMIIKMVSWGKNDLEQTNMTSIAITAFKIMLFSGEVASGVSDEENDASSAMKITIPDLQKIMDLSTQGAKYDHKINWERYMNVLLGGMRQSFNIGKDIVSVSDIHYFKKLAFLIANSQMETIQRYVWWQVVELLAPHTNKAMRDLRNEMLEKFFGKIQIPSRSTLCLRQVKKLLPMAVSYTKAKQVDFNSTVLKVTEMLNDIKHSFNSLVQEGDWINPETKQAAQEKAKAIASFVGYQEWLLQPGKLDEYYGELELKENQYLLSVLKIKRREVNDFLNQILNKKYGSHKNESWNDIDPLQVNAYYSRTENAIIIPAGILQFPFYGRGLESLNYGSIGSILGHELTHGFDIEGKNYGKDGKRVSWWNTDMLKAYEDRAQCFIEQYNSFGSENYKVNGKQTLAENIADNGGIREAYKAYQKYKERHGPEPYLPGLESFTHEQLLFLAFANIWCIDEGPDYESLAIKDSHSPGRYRVLGSLSNSPEFTETWMCPTNTSMNPSSRCIIW